VNILAEDHQALSDWFSGGNPARPAVGVNGPPAAHSGDEWWAELCGAEWHLWTTNLPALAHAIAYRNASSATSTRPAITPSTSLTWTPPLPLESGRCRCSATPAATTEWSEPAARTSRANQRAESRIGQAGLSEDSGARHIPARSASPAVARRTARYRPANRVASAHHFPCPGRGTRGNYRGAEQHLRKSPTGHWPGSPSGPRTRTNHRGNPTPGRVSGG
jgi:hypothetical protein